MPTISECQALIQMVSLSAEQEMDDFIQRDLKNDSEDIEMNSSIDSSDSLLLSLSLSSELSSLSSSLSSSSSSSGIQITDISSDGEEHAIAMAETAALLQVIMGTSILNPHEVAKSSQFHLVLVEFKANDPKCFHQNLSVSPNMFDMLLNMIKGDLVFSNNSTALHISVDKQLAITLLRFDHNGNAASIEAIAQWAGVSCGTVVNSTHRVMIMFLALHDSVVYWPSEEEKEVAKGWIESASCTEWQGGFCMVNGTLVPLFEKLGHHNEAYFDRKSNYLLNVQVTLSLLVNYLCV